MENKKKPPYRPTIYSDKLVNDICDRLAKGESLRTICKDPKMPARKTVHLWLLDDNKKNFLHQYAIAKDIGADELFDELNEIASNEEIDVNRARLIVDTKKWYLSKVIPKKFGDKMDLTSDNKPINLQDEQVERIIERTASRIGISSLGDSQK